MSAIPIAGAPRRRSARGPLLLAAACVLALALTWVLAALVPATHIRDATVLYDFTRLNRPFVEIPASVLLELLEPAFFVIWALVLVLLTYSRGRPRVALAVALALAAAPISAELLKPLFAHTHAQVAPLYINSASWPSGHATAATILAWCAVMVAPPSLRRKVALLGLAFVLAVGCALLVLAWHMPSDVLGGYLLATLWFSLTLAVLRAIAPVEEVSPSRRPSRPRARPEPTAAPPPLGRLHPRSPRAPG